MGVKQSKRSVDITETSTKGEIEGFGNEGKVEKIVDGVVDKIEKMTVNGHMDGDLQNGGEAHQNGLDTEAAIAVTEKTFEKEVDETVAEGTVNGQVENGGVNGEAEKVDEESKKAEDKKDKKKEKKEKIIKKKFSFRNFSFSKKDKSKPPKEEKSPEKVDEAGLEEPTNGAEKGVFKIASPTQEEPAEMTKTEESDKIMNAETPLVNAVTERTNIDASEHIVDKTSEVVTKYVSEDLPPPLPASPPPSEPVDAKLADSDELTKSHSGILESLTGKLEEVTSSFSSTFSEKMESSEEILKDAEKIAIQTGKQIEEKATSLLKTVEKRAEESLKTAGSLIAQQANDAVEIVENALKINAEKDIHEEMEATGLKLEETVNTIPVEASDLAALASKTEEAVDKNEDFGAGESLADIPKDMAGNISEENVEISNPDSLEVTKTLPPPPIEAATGE